MDEILNLIESVSEGFPSYFWIYSNNILGIAEFAIIFLYLFSVSRCILIFFSKIKLEFGLTVGIYLMSVPLLSLPSYFFIYSLFLDAYTHIFQ